MNTHDKVSVTDGGLLKASSGESRGWDELSDESVVGVTGWVKMVMRERGKIVTTREGKNVWTNSGREFLAMLMSLANPLTSQTVKLRADSIAYIGMGSGSNPTAGAGIISVVSPLAVTAGVFLTLLDVPSFPLAPARTTVRYHCTFLENQLTYTGGSSVSISEMGLFTNGDPLNNFAVSPARSLSIGVAGTSAPCAYKTFDPLTKTDTMQVDVSWEIRF